MTVDLLEQRLHDLDVETPDAGRVAARVLARHTGPRGRRVPRVASASVALVVLVALIAYFVPAADLAVAAKVPWGGEVLQWAGLVGASDRITYVNATATSSGYRLTLMGAYADSSRTVLLMHADPALSAPPTTSLTDQFARSYRIRGGVGNMETGDLVMQFEPLTWPDSITGARITLHVSQLEAATPPYGPGTNVTGNWELTAALGVDAATALPLPAPGDLGPAHFRFTSASYTPATIEVDVDLTGVSGEELSRIVPDGLKGQPALQIDLLDSSGNIIGGMGESSGDQSGEQIRVFAFRTGGGGKYVVRVGYYGYGSFDRELVIPS